MESTKKWKMLEGQMMACAVNLRRNLGIETQVANDSYLSPQAVETEVIFLTDVSHGS